MMRPFRVLIAIAAVLPATPSPARAPVRRDVESYAVASCLLAQPSAYLKEQGDGWASNIAQRDGFRVTAFARLDRIVKAEVGRGRMATVRVEQPPMTIRPLPVQYCAEIVDAPPVRAQIEATIRLVGKGQGHRPGRRAGPAAGR